MYKSGHVQVESTSFTVSEPVESYEIAPLIFQFANSDERRILTEYSVAPFNIQTIKLERIFVDKIFAIEYYYERQMLPDAAKHLYDITVLSDHPLILALLNDKTELNRLISLKRMEESVRSGGVSESLQITDFAYFDPTILAKIIPYWQAMQDVYVMGDEYKIPPATFSKAIAELLHYFQ